MEREIVSIEFVYVCGDNEGNSVFRVMFNPPQPNAYLFAKDELDVYKIFNQKEQ